MRQESLRNKIGLALPMILALMMFGVIIRTVE